MTSKILAADDDKNLLKLYARIFAGKEYALTTAGSFTEASRLIEANSYDLLVTDLMFPDGLGTELIKLFKKKRAGAKSLLVTGSPEAVERSECAGITGYFLKPFEVWRFMTAVTKALNG